MKKKIICEKYVEEMEGMRNEENETLIAIIMLNL